MTATEPLSIDRLNAAVTVLGEGFARRWQILAWEEVTSTNQVLWERIAAGAQPGTVVVASRQTAGRGQRSHQWLSQPGGLYLSAAVRPDILARYSPQLTLACAWGIAAALRDRQIPVSLKWLNDLLLQGRKLGGILTETRLRGDRLDWAVVGVGVNWRNPVPEVGTNLKQFWAEHPQVRSLSLEMLAALVLSGIDRGLQRLQTSGIEAILPDYQALLVNLHQPIQRDEVRGTIIGVSGDGSLIVRRQEGGRVRIPPGTLSLGYPANFRENRADG
jgi:BirA family biotin operon repressor/biotin-[acetyl-CoA-carboxylase] ligase